ncbi:Uncharacterised protein [Mycobacteroides abscessus subsp. abscessus]|nr:Uncharacterised protein [Mycobacteroides abscessus subsp. abscessus]
MTPSIWHSNHMDSCDEDSGKRSGRSAATRSGRPSCGAASISSDSSRSSSSSSISNSSRKYVTNCSASPAGVGRSNTARTVRSMPNCARICATKRAARSECPPSSKNESSSPTASFPNRCE